MSRLELVDETFLAAPASAVSLAVHDQTRWEEWWPGLRLAVFMDRGVQGIRWSAHGREWAGSLEIWLESFGDGVVLHHYQRLDPSQGESMSGREVEQIKAQRAKAWKRQVYLLKDALEADRRPGEPAPTVLELSSTPLELPTTPS